MVVVIVLETLRGFLRFLRKKPWLIILLLLAFFVVADTMTFYYLEGGTQELTLFDALYWTMITMATIGYGDIIPRTFEGRILALTTAVVGIAAFTAFISIVAESFLSMSIKKSMGLGRMGRVDVVVVGDAEECVETIRELKANLQESKIVWVTSQVPKVDLEVEFVVGGLSDESTLKRGGVGRARHIVLCTREDATALYLSLLCRKLNRKARISGIARSKKARELLEETGIDHVVSSELLARILASTVFEPGVADFFEKVSTARGEYDVVEVSAEKYSDLSWGEVEARVREELKSTPLGVVRGKETIISPSREFKLEKRDRLILLRVYGRTGKEYRV